MKKTNKMRPLVLKKDTIRPLGPIQLETIAGGQRPSVEACPDTHYKSCGC